jgi:DNA-binding NarL/FixJ family response regulator
MSNGLITVAVCESQPLLIEGLCALLGRSPGFHFAGGTDSLAAALDLVREVRPSIAVVDKSFGLSAVVDWISSVKPLAAPVLLGGSIGEVEALRGLQAGALGILQKTAAVETVLACFRTVAEGRTWMDQSVATERDAARGYRPQLTSREQQVLELVEQGWKNKDIGAALGIRPGTVKIHLKHIFEKTGIRGRYGLALSGLRQKSAASARA